MEVLFAKVVIFFDNNYQSVILINNFVANRTKTMTNRTFIKKKRATESMDYAKGR